MPRPRKAFVINGTSYTELEARELFNKGYYQMVRMEQGNSTKDHRLSPVTVGNVDYVSAKEARIALGLTRSEFRRLYPTQRNALFPAEINGTVYQSWQEARDALGWCRSKVYAYAQRSKRNG